MTTPPDAVLDAALDANPMPRSPLVSIGESSVGTFGFTDTEKKVEGSSPDVGVSREYQFQARVVQISSAIEYVESKIAEERAKLEASASQHGQHDGGEAAAMPAPAGPGPGDQDVLDYLELAVVKFREDLAEALTLQRGSSGGFGAGAGALGSGATRSESGRNLSLPRRVDSRQTSSAASSSGRGSVTSSRDPSRSPSKAAALAVHIDRSHIHYDPDLDLVGNGAAGCVYRAKWLGDDNQWVKNGERVAVKRLMIEIDDMANDEVTLLTSLAHKNVVKFFGICRHITPSAQTVMLVTEFCEGGSLQEYLADPEKEMGHAQLLGWALDIANGVHYLHEGQTKAIVHRDLKSGNVLIGKDSHGKDALKLCDFGSSISINEWMATDLKDMDMVGTAAWMAPEIIRMESEADIGPKCDIYSMGVVFWEMLTRKVPFENITAVRVIMMVGSGDYTLPIPDQAPPNVKKLVTDCMSPDAKNRPTAEEVVDQLKAIKNDKKSVQTMEALLEDRGQWVDKLVKDVAEQAKEKQKLNENLMKYQIAIMVLFTAMLLMLVYFVQPWEDKDHLRAAHSAFDKFKGDDEKLNVSELKLAFNSLIGQHQLPEDTVGDMMRILESYDVHDAHADGGAVEFDEAEFTIAVSTENTHYGVLRQRMSSVLKVLFGWENVSLGNELRELKQIAGSPLLFLVGAALIVASVYNIAMDEPGGAKAVAVPTKRRLIKLSLRGVTLVKVVNVFLLLLAATIFSTAILDEISGSEVAERVLEILAVTLILLSGLKWRRGALAVQLPSRRRDITRSLSRTKRKEPLGTKKEV